MPNILMTLDYSTLMTLRQNHPAWKLLCAQHAPFIASFLHRVFVIPNARNLSQTELVEALEDDLFVLRDQLGEEAFPGTAQGYLDDWANDDKGWLRKFYQPGIDIPYFDLTPAAEKALLWLEGLTERPFIGTESRLLTLFDLLRQMVEGSQEDPQIRVAELQKRRDDIDSEISRILSGDIPLLDDTALKDRYQQVLYLSKSLPADFREVEHNFHVLNQEVRKRITTWEGGKGALLEEIMNKRDAIANSDQGKNFRAFWDLLMSPSLQEELTGLLEQVLSLPAIQSMNPSPRLRRIHYDWLEASEHTQRVIAKLSEQLRKFLDDYAKSETRRIMEILRDIEGQAIIIKEKLPLPRGGFMSLSEISPTVNLPLERSLFSPPLTPFVTDIATDGGNPDLDLTVLYSQIMVDRAELTRNIQQDLREYGQTSLAEIITRHPLRYGLAELIVYVQLAEKRPRMVIDDKTQEEVRWQSDAGVMRQAMLSRIILLKEGELDG